MHQKQRPWRLSRNDVVPTVFVSDSRLVGDQAAGGCGSTIKDMPYYNLRAVFQALHAGLPGQGLQVEHVRSHTGDPFNELVDWIAKQEPHESQYLPRQAVNMCTFQSILRHLWIATAADKDRVLCTTHCTSSGSTSFYRVAQEDMQAYDLQHQSRHCECQNILSW